MVAMAATMEMETARVTATVAMLDPNATLVNIGPAGTGTLGNTVTTFTTPKLTQ